MMLYTTGHVLRKSIFGSHRLIPSGYEREPINELDETDDLGSWVHLQAAEDNGIHYFLNQGSTGNLEKVSLCGDAELKPFSKVFRYPVQRQPDNSDSNCLACREAILALRNE